MRRLALLTAVLVTALAVTGCGTDEEPPTGSSTTNGVELDLQGEPPQLQRVQVAPGEELELVITSDEPGELHVHTSPEERVVEYGAGTTTEILTFDQPGVVDVELHDPEVLVLQLEVG